MSVKTGPVVIKKYANRRLYNKGTSTYITLDDLAAMIRRGEEFSVQDAKTHEDLTHFVLTQIIFELENRLGENLLPNQFLRQLIAFYGDQMQTIVPDFLEQSMSAFARERARIRKETGMDRKTTCSAGAAAASMQLFEQKALQSIELWQQAWGALSCIEEMAVTAPKSHVDETITYNKPAALTGRDEELETLRAQLSSMQKRLNELGG